MKYRHWMILSILAMLVLGCAPTPSIGTEVVATPSITPTQNGTDALTSASLPSMTFTVSSTRFTILTVIPTATPALTAVVLTVSQVAIGLSVGKNMTFTSCAHTNPVVFTGTITTSSSTTVEYDWLLRGAATFNSPPQTTVFHSAERHKVFSLAPYYAVCGKYSLSLHVITPNYMIATINFFIP
ncbi:MAG: hypothetical protein WCA79_09645 [Anaerolineales bacterium]